MKQIPENVKLVARSVAPFIVVVVLFILVVHFGVPKILDLRNQINSAGITQNVLTQKVATLQTISSTVSDFSSAATIAVPDSNTSLAVISQLKTLAIQGGLLISGIKGGTEVKDSTGLSRVDINFKASGSRAQVMTFLEGVSNIAPITTVGRIKIEESGGVTTADVAVSSYWAALPKTLPATDQALADLTADEKKILSKVSSLTQPTFTQVLPATGGGKSDPFAQ